MSDSASLEDDFSIIQVEDTYHSTESMLTKSQYAKVIFHDIADAYPTDSDICCRYTLTDGVAVNVGDRVELFRVGWSQVKESLVHRNVPECTEAGQCDFQVLFQAAELPKDLCDFYQLCYVTAEGGVCGASVPFQFRVPEATELCAVEEAGDLLVYRSRESITDLKLRQADDSLISLRLEMTRKDLELEKLLACLEASDTEKKLLKKRVEECDHMEQQVQQLQTDMATLVRDKIEAKDREHMLKALRLDMRTSSEEVIHLRGQVESLQLMLEALTQSKDLMAQELRVKEDTIEQMIKQANAKEADIPSLTEKLEDAEEQVASLKKGVEEMEKRLSEEKVFRRCFSEELHQLGTNNSQLQKKEGELTTEIEKLAEENRKLADEKLLLIIKGQKFAEENRDLVIQNEELIAEKQEAVEGKQKLAEEMQKVVEQMQKAAEKKKEDDALRAELSKSLQLTQEEVVQNQDLTMKRELEPRESKLEDVIRGLGRKIESVAPLVKHLLENDVSRNNPCPQFKRLVDMVQVEGLWGPAEDLKTVMDEEAALQLELASLELEGSILKEKETIIEQRMQEIALEQLATNDQIQKLNVSYKAHLDTAVSTRNELEKAEHRFQVGDFEYVDSWGGANCSLEDLTAQLVEMEVLAESSHLALIQLEKWKASISEEVSTLEEGMRKTRAGLAKTQQLTLETQDRLPAVVLRRDVARRNHETSQLLGHCSGREDSGTKGLEQQVTELKLSLKMAADEYRRIFVEKQKLERRLNKLLAKIEVKRSTGSSSGSMDITTASTSNSGGTEKDGPRFGFICPFCSVTFPPGSHDLFTEHFDNHIS